MNTQLASSLFTDLKSRIDARQARVGIIGLGYVGLPLALLYSEQRFPVTGFDIDQQGQYPDTAAPTLSASRPRRSQAAKLTGSSATADYSQITAMDAIIICVPTPLNEYHEPDLSYITDTAQAIAPHLRAGQFVMLESTTYPGHHGRSPDSDSRKGEQGRPEGLPATATPATASSALRFRRSAKIPATPGGSARYSQSDRRTRSAGQRNRMRRLYGSIFSRTVPVSSARRGGDDQAAREHLPLRQHRAGQRTQDALPAHGHRHLGGHRGRRHQAVRLSCRFIPGPGLGGHCIPVDPFYLSWKAKEFDFRTRFIELAGEINVAMPYHVIASTIAALNRQKKAINGSKVLVLGMAYKRDIDDLRESPSLTIIELLQKEGAEVSYNDPYFPSSAAAANTTCK